VSGNKLSTNIKGLSQYAIDEQEIATALSRQLSVSVSLVEGGIYCQGDLREKLVKYLTEHVGIPKDCIAVKN
jgi:translation initiation factor 1 (eIF-1/SUI1)